MPPRRRHPKVARPLRGTLRLAGKQPTVQRTQTARINGTATLPPVPPVTINGTGAMH